MKGKVVSLIVAGCLAAGMLAGCGAKVREDAPAPSSASSASSVSSSSAASSAQDANKTYANGLKIDSKVEKMLEGATGSAAYTFTTVDTSRATYDTALSTGGADGLITDGTVVVAVPFYNRYSAPMPINELIKVEVKDKNGSVLPCVADSVVLLNNSFTTAQGTPFSAANVSGGPLDVDAIGWAYNNFAQPIGYVYDGPVVTSDAVILNPSACETEDPYFNFSNVNVAVLIAKFAMADTALNRPSDYTVVVTDLIANEKNEITKVAFNESAYPRN